MSKRIPEEIRKYISGNGIMTLATSDPEPWVCTLYYGIDEDFNFYLVSNPNSVHGKMLSKNSKVAFSIYDSHTKITEAKMGIQGKGICTFVTGLKETARGLVIWHKANPGIEAKITFEDVKKWKDTKIFRIKPTYLKFFNKDLYGKDEYGVWEL